MSQSQTSSPIPPPNGMSPETDRLFRKWLKLQISSMYIEMLFRIVMFVLVAGSLVFSAITLAPIVQSQLGVLTKMMGTVSNLYGYTTPEPTAQSQTEKKDDSMIDSGIIEKLSDEQRQLLIEMLKK